MGCGASSAKQQTQQSDSKTVLESTNEVTVTSSTPQKPQQSSNEIATPVKPSIPQKEHAVVEDPSPIKQSSPEKQQDNKVDISTVKSDHDDLVQYDDNVDRRPSIAEEVNMMKQSPSRASTASSSDESTDVHLSGLSSRNESPMSESSDVFSSSPSPDKLTPMVIDVPLKRPNASAKKSALQIRLEKQSRERQQKKQLSREDIEAKLKRAEENQRKQNEDKILRAKGLTSLKPLGSIKKQSTLNSLSSSPSSSTWGSQSLPPLSKRTPLKSLGNTTGTTVKDEDLFEDVLAALEE